MFHESCCYWPPCKFFRLLLTSTCCFFFFFFSDTRLKAEAVARGAVINTSGMLQIYPNTKDMLVLSLSSRQVAIETLRLLEIRNTFGLTFMVWFILECYWTTAPLNCPVNFFLCASIQRNTLIFPFNAALQLDMKEMLLSSASSISESIKPFFLKCHDLFLIKQCRHFVTRMQIMS